MFEGSTFWMTIGIPGWDVEIIQNSGLVDEIRGDGYVLWQFPEQASHNMPPGFLPEREMESFDSFLCSLLGRKACPFVAFRPLRILGQFKVTLGLFEPIIRTIWHNATSLGCNVAYYAQKIQTPF
jgi:hypothetical protein